MSRILELHPLCTLFPRMEGAEFSALVRDIAENGQREPIILVDGMILDGGNRYRACLEAGVEPQTMNFGGGNIVTYVLSANLHRRHMTPGQQAAIVAAAQDWAKAQTVGKPKTGNLAELSRTQDRAAQSGASERTQSMADKVAREAPELVRRVARGEVSLPAAVEQITGKRPGAKRAPDTPAENQYTTEDELHDLKLQLQEALGENQNLRAQLAGEEATQLRFAELMQELKSARAEIDSLRLRIRQMQTTEAEMKRQLSYNRKHRAA